MVQVRPDATTEYNMSHWSEPHIHTVTLSDKRLRQQNVRLKSFTRCVDSTVVDIGLYTVHVLRKAHLQIRKLATS